MRNIVVVGGGFGGVAAVNALVENLTPRRRVQVTLISDRDHFLFTPLLTNAAGGDISPSSIQVPLQDAVGESVRVEVDQISKLDLTQRIVRGTLDYSYDGLILSPGSQTAWGDFPQWKTRAMTCKSAQDAEVIRAHIDASVMRAKDAEEKLARQALSFVVIGGGPTGVTLMAEIVDYLHTTHLVTYPSLAPLVRFVLIDRRRRLLADMPADLASLCRTQLERMGVELVVQTAVTNIEHGHVETTRGDYVTDNVFWCGGVRGPEWLTHTALPLNHEGRIRVDERLCVEGCTGIYAIGDSAAGPWPWSAQVATQQAVIAAKNVLADLTGRTWSKFDYAYEGDILPLGQNNAAIYYRGVAFEGRTARTLHRILYTALVPSGVRKMLVFRDWLSAGFRKPQGRISSE